MNLTLDQFTYKANDINILHYKGNDSYFNDKYVIRKWLLLSLKYSI